MKSWKKYGVIFLVLRARRNREDKRGKEGAKRERGLHQMSDEENEDEEEENPNPEQLPIDNSDF